MTSTHLPGRGTAAPLLVILAVLVTACSPMENPDSAGPPAPEYPEVIRYTALGDSLATGTGAESSYVDEYAAWIEEETASTVEVTNVAVDGWTSHDLLEMLDTDGEVRAAVGEAHVITWSIGGNDLLDVLAQLLRGACESVDPRPCLEDGVEGAVERSDEVIREILALRDGDPDGLRTFDLYLPFSGHPYVGPFVDLLRPHLDAFNTEVAATAAAHDVPVGEVHRAFHGPDGDGDPSSDGLISHDGLHPSDHGHRVIAEVLADLGLELADRD